jgi:hypothetical protein
MDPLPSSSQSVVETVRAEVERVSVEDDAAKSICPSTDSNEYEPFTSEIYESVEDGVTECSVKSSAHEPVNESLVKEGVAFADDNGYGEPVEATVPTLDDSSGTALEPSESRVNVAEPYVPSVQDDSVTGLSELVKEAAQQVEMSIENCAAVYEQHRLINKMSVDPMFSGNATTLEIVEIGVEQSSIRDDVVNYICTSDENSDYEPLGDVNIEESAADGVLE